MTWLYLYWNFIVSRVRDTKRLHGIGRILSRVMWFLMKNKWTESCLTITYTVNLVLYCLYLNPISSIFVYIFVRNWSCTWNSNSACAVSVAKHKEWERNLLVPIFKISSYHYMPPINVEIALHSMFCLKYFYFNKKILVWSYRLKITDSLLFHLQPP